MKECMHRSSRDGTVSPPYALALTAEADVEVFNDTEMVAFDCRDCSHLHAMHQSGAHLQRGIQPHCWRAMSAGAGLSCCCMVGTEPLLCGDAELAYNRLAGDQRLALVHLCQQVINATPVLHRAGGGVY